MREEEPEGFTLDFLAALRAHSELAARLLARSAVRRAASVWPTGSGSGSGGGSGGSSSGSSGGGGGLTSGAVRWEERVPPEAQTVFYFAPASNALQGTPPPGFDEAWLAEQVREGGRACVRACVLSG